MTTGGFINLFTNPCQSKVKVQCDLTSSHPLIWELKKFYSDFELSKLESLPSSSLPPIARNYIVSRILARSKARGFIPSNYVCEFHSKLKAFMSDSKWRL